MALAVAPFGREGVPATLAVALGVWAVELEEEGEGAPLLEGVASPELLAARLRLTRALPLPEALRSGVRDREGEAEVLTVGAARVALRRPEALALGQAVLVTESEDEALSQGLVLDSSVALEAAEAEAPRLALVLPLRERAGELLPRGLEEDVRVTEGLAEEERDTDSVAEPENVAVESTEADAALVALGGALKD